MLPFLMLIVLISGCTKELDDYIEVFKPEYYSSPEMEPGTKSFPYELPEIKTEKDFENVIYIDPSGSNGNGTIDSPFNSLNGITIQSNTAYLIKRGTILKEKVGRLQAEDSHRVLRDMIWNNNFIGAYGEGARPVVNGFFIWEGSDGLTIRDLNIRAESQWSSGWDAVVYIHNVDVKNITVAYCEISGIYNDSNQKSYPYAQPSGPFAYPLLGIKAQGHNITIYRNIVKDVWSTGMWIGTTSNLKVVRNWIHDIVRAYQFIGINKEMLTENPNNVSGNCLSFQWEYENLYVAGNILDKSASEWKSAFSLGYQKGWGSTKRGYIIEYNTFVSPKAGSGGSGTYFVAPPESYLRYNLFDGTNQGSQSGCTPITSAGTLIRDHLQQNDPVYITKNHIIKHRADAPATYPDSDEYFANCNKVFDTFAEYNQYLKEKGAVRFGSDIDKNNFWEDIY